VQNRHEGLAIYSVRNNTIDSLKYVFEERLVDVILPNHDSPPLICIHFFAFKYEDVLGDDFGSHRL